MVISTLNPHTGFLTVNGDFNFKNPHTGFLSVKGLALIDWTSEG
jgi:hypothetical protein